MYYQERICRRYDKFIVLTEKDRLMRGNIPNMIVIPNFITIESSDSMPVAESRKVIAVGRLSIERDLIIYFRHGLWYLLNILTGVWKFMGTAMDARNIIMS